MPGMFTAKTRPRSFLVLFFLTIGVCVLAACSRPDANNSGPTPVLSGPPSTTFPMPPIQTDGWGADLGWTLADGKRVSLSGHRGKILVLDLYATWCEPCRQSIPHLIELQQRYETKGLQLVGLNVGGPDDRVKVPSFAVEFRISYQLGFPDQPLVDLFLSDDSSIPQAYVFNREGRLLKRFIGYDGAMPAQLEQVIRAELAAEAR